MTEGVTLLETSVVTVVLRQQISDISFHACGMDSLGCAARSIDGFSSKCKPGFQESMSMESVGVYEVM